MSEHLSETDTDSQRMTHLHARAATLSTGREGNEFLKSSQSEYLMRKIT